MFVPVPAHAMLSLRQTHPKQGPHPCLDECFPSQEFH